MGLKFRRGTTAQKSGSLAFGEPYVNTDLGTLQIGGASGDITLGASGTGSAGVFSAISGSGLDITGNANIAGNLTLGGNITIGDNTSDTVAMTANLSSSIIPSLTNAFDLGSPTKIWKDLYISTGSIKFVDPGTNAIVGTLSSNAGGDFKVAGEISGSTIAGLGNATLYSSSVDSKLVNTLASASAYSQSLNTSISESNAVATSYSASAASALSSVSGAVATSLTNASSSAYSTFAKLSGDNTFTGTQTITGSLYVSSNLIVQGSSSLQNITASAVSIGTNTVILNTDNPAIRYGGIAVTDSGSAAGKSGSFLFDSADNEWIFVHQGNAAVTSSTMITGPETFNDLGNELHLTDNKLVKAAGGFHIVDSNISDNGTKVTVTGGLDVTGALSASTITGIGNVATHSSSVATRLNSLETSTTTSTLSSSVATDFSASTAARVELSASIASTDSTQTTNITANSASAWRAFQSASSYSSSFYTTINTNINNIASTSASAAGAFASASAYSSSFYTTINTNINNIASNSASAAGAFASASAYSSSVKVVTDSIGSRVTTLEGKDISITLTGDVTGTGTITDLANVSFVTTIAADSVALGTDTTGNYVASMTAGAGITVGTATGEGSTPVITNTGVTSVSAGTGITLGATTGACSIAIGQAVATTDNVRFNSVGVGMAASATAGRIDAAGDVVAYSSSDKNFKENITPIENPIEKIRKISGNTYDWKADLKDVHGYEGNDVGVIAQEIEEVLPQIVTTRENGYKAVKYEKLVALLIEGIKAQQNQIDSLTIEVEKLKKNNSL